MIESKKQPFVVGITGGSASGKTTFLNALLSQFTAQEVCLLSQDNYYRDRDQQPVDENGMINFDLPKSIDLLGFASDILALKSGQAIQREEYTFNNSDVAPKMLTFEPAPIIVVEGLFVFYEPLIAEHLDLKIFVDAEEHIKLKRRIIRDNAERGYDLEEVLYRYEQHVIPTYKQYIAPFKSSADLVVPNNSTFDMGMEVVSKFLKSKIG
ncbi:uridine kinase [Persicobacter psychrovividus]|uniref:uridine/cytidine kinase n=1 Tax=Persicobacter psychrovividus TaxID=387638 RepID=A0ABM7VGH0_9BACT|nr:uridine kinase [Persicobacter psychrovividus]